MYPFLLYYNSSGENSVFGDGELKVSMSLGKDKKVRTFIFPSWLSRML